MQHQFFEEIKRAASAVSPGPLPQFTLPHLIKAITLIGEMKGIGRKRVSEIMGIGEGTARTMIQRLQDLGLIEVSRGGCKLTSKGEEVYESLRRLIQGPFTVKMSGVWEYSANVGVLIRGASKLIKYGIEQRDAAVRYGAKGALTVIRQDGRLVMPGSSDVTSEYPVFADSLERTFRPRDGDVIIIVGAADELKAELGAIAAILVTLGLES
ncbi:MAG: DUF4443 domain-containing protein [Aigarchaeota archaeon]|nr:DUF4443 domain-containing protein [Aigarchaeota archaeon]MDW8093188.1 DUF4443 domain-containing protein [Nitrososphaerota archaeon]